MTATSLASRLPAIGFRPAERPRLWPLLVLSIALHVAVALGLAFVLSRHLGEKQKEPLDLGIDVTLGDAVQELIVAEPIPEPPAPAAPAPPPPLPEPLPLPAAPPPPPPVEMPEVIETKPLPEPVTKPPPKREPRKPPAKAKTGPVPRAGVVGGNVTQGATAGTPGGQKIGDQGWRTPKPPYPRAAQVARIQGSVEIRVTTDAAGRVKEAVITRSVSPILDANTRSFARSHWKGPPNATRLVPVIYRIP